jgi:hypothetical protein
MPCGAVLAKPFTQKKGVMLGGVKFTPIFPVISFSLKASLLLKRAIMPKGCLSV